MYSVHRLLCEGFQVFVLSRNQDLGKRLVVMGVVYERKTAGISTIDSYYKD